MTKALYLVNPPDKGMLSGFPGALLFLSAWVRMNLPKIKVNYIDLALSKKERFPVESTVEAIEKELRNYDTDEGAIYGITATTATYQNALQVAQAIKQKDPQSKIILGGHHAMHEAEIILREHSEIDYCAIGEGEHTLVDLILERHIDDIRGIAYRDAGLVKRNSVQLLKREELDRFTFNSFDWEPIQASLQDEKIRGQFGYFDITTARGCNLKCPFCTFGDDQLRDMSPKAKAKLLSEVVNREIYKQSRGLNIHDNDFAQNIRKTHELCDLIIDNIIAKGHDFRWTIQTRVEHCNGRNEALVEKLAKAGCVEVYYGVENFDPDIAKYLKHVNDVDRYLRDTKEAIINTLKCGIKCTINLQMGVPGETESSRLNNLEALRVIAEATEGTKQSTGLDSGIVITPQLSVIYPGTAMARMPVRGTESRLPLDAFEVFTRWEWEQEQQGLVDYLGKNFAHGNGGIPLGLIDVDRFVETGEIAIVPEKLNALNLYLDRIRAISRQHPVLNVIDYSNDIHV